MNPGSLNPHTSPSTSVHSENLERVRAALSHLSPETRAVWVRQAMAIKSEFGDDGFEMWDEWSSLSKTYRAIDARDVWKSVKAGKGITIASLFYDAKQSGWKDDTAYKKPSAAEIEQRRKERAERNAIAAAQELAAQEAAAAKAQELWAAAAPCEDHAYLGRKGVKSHGLRYGRFDIETVDHITGEVKTIGLQALLMPIIDRSFKIWTLQAFSAKPDGRKSLLKDGRKSGNFFVIGSKPLVVNGRPVFILVEGYATGASVHEATGHMVMVCVDAGNLPKVAKNLRKDEPASTIVIAADNDSTIEGNPGLTQANKAADAVSGVVLFPSFAPGDDTPNGEAATDWNDWGKVYGAPSVADFFSQQLGVIDDAVAEEPAFPHVVELPERRTIEVIPGNLGEAVNAGELALRAQCPYLYKRSGQIVRPLRGERVEAAHGSTVYVTKLHPLNKHGLVEALTDAAVWTKVDGRRRKDGEFVRMNCPMNIAETLLARGEWNLRPLTAIIDAPTLRADGSILDKQGYDCRTGLLLEPGADFPPVPQKPTQVDALNALQRLSLLVEGFPFVGEEDRSVWLAALLTACVRRSLSTAPMFAFSAPAAGSGKSLLVDLVSIISSGARAPVFSQGRDEEEMEKRVAAALLAGHGVVSIDNCTLPIDGDLLCQALTQPTLTLRPLGSSITRSVPASATFFANGNSLVIAGDMTRRVLLCNLDAGQERPELREFEFNPLEQAQAGRAGYLVDVLTILRAFCVAGYPKQEISTLGSFEQWSECVRSALLWLHLPDPVRTMERTRVADPKLSALRAAMNAWYSVFGTRSVLVREAIDLASQHRNGIYPSRTEVLHPDFQEALMTVAGVAGRINSRTLGKWLASNRGRIVGGKRFIHHGIDRNGIAKWGVEEVMHP
ncbi:MAG: PriCT-2 domain-containing protein [Burkholderiaceae bacterium]|nr:PriCT-2 domain-containing protein [Burkholderiaceae bacterium]